MTETQVKELRELLAKATPGEWFGLPAVVDGISTHVVSIDDETALPEEARGDGRNVAAFLSGNDASLIAALKNAAPALLDAWEEREKMREALQRMLRAYEQIPMSIVADGSALRMARAALSGEKL